MGSAPAGARQRERRGISRRSLCALLEAQDDAVGIEESGGGFEVRQQTWKLMADVGDYHPACARVLEGLFAGLAAGCGRHIPLAMRAADGGGPPFLWSIG